jgi:hypothetical protein
VVAPELFLSALRKPSPAFPAHVPGAEIAAHPGHDHALRLHRFRQRPIDLDAEIVKKPVDLSPRDGDVAGFLVDRQRRASSTACAAFKDGMPIGDENVDPAACIKRSARAGRPRREVYRVHDAAARAELHALCRLSY